MGPACFGPPGFGLRVFSSPWGDRLALAAVKLALRQQLAILHRSVKRPRFFKRDRILWVWLSGVWLGWRSALLIVQPDFEGADEASRPFMLPNAQPNRRRTVGLDRMAGYTGCLATWDGPGGRPTGNPHLRWSHLVCPLNQTPLPRAARPGTPGPTRDQISIQSC